MLADRLFEAAVIFVSGLVHGLLGLGFPMVATPVLSLATDVKSAVIRLLLPTLMINVAVIARMGSLREGAGRFWPLIVYTTAGSMLGSRLLVAADPAPYKLLLAGVILVYLNIERLGIRLTWVKSHPGLSMAAFGSVAGFLAGTVNVTVPPLIIFFLELGVSPGAMVQVFNLCFLAGKSAQGLVFLKAGLLTPGVVFSAIPFIFVALAGLYLGMKIQGRIHAETYRRWLRKVLSVISVLLVLQYLQSLFAG